MNSPKTHNLTARTREDALHAGREAAKHGREMWQCPWVKDWAAQHGPVSQDDPRIDEIMHLWQWAHDDEKGRTNVQ